LLAQVAKSFFKNLSRQMVDNAMMAAAAEEEK
jgi:hypothetical protein